MNLADIWGATDAEEAVQEQVARRRRLISTAMKYINEWLEETTLAEERVLYRLGVTDTELAHIRHYGVDFFDKPGMRTFLLEVVQVAANGWCTAPGRHILTPAQSLAKMNEGLDIVVRGFE